MLKTKDNISSPETKIAVVIYRFRSRQNNWVGKDMEL